MTTRFTLRFTKWQCGHHGQRPADIEVSSPEQAIQIAWAIAHAISQPGSARAVLMTADRAETIYMTDDYVSVGLASGDKIGDQYTWAERPIVIVGTQAEVDALHADELKQARDTVLTGVLERFDPQGCLYGGEVVTTTLAQAEIEAMARPLDAFEEGGQQFELPPVFRNAADVLADLRQEAADQAAYDAEVAAEKAAGDDSGSAA